MLTKKQIVFQLFKENQDRYLSDKEIAEETGLLTRNIGNYRRAIMKDGHGFNVKSHLLDNNRYGLSHQIRLKDPGLVCMDEYREPASTEYLRSLLPRCHSVNSIETLMCLCEVNHTYWSQKVLSDMLHLDETSVMKRVHNVIKGFPLELHSRGSTGNNREYVVIVGKPKSFKREPQVKRGETEVQKLLRAWV